MGEMKIEKGKIYKVLAKSKSILFLPDGSFYDYGSKIEGEFDSKTLYLIMDSIEILVIDEKLSNSPSTKNVKSQKVETPVMQEELKIDDKNKEV